MICERRLGLAVQAYADELYEGDWSKVTVAELRAIIAVLETFLSR